MVSHETKVGPVMLAKDARPGQRLPGRGVIVSVLRQDHDHLWITTIVNRVREGKMYRDHDQL